MNQLLPTQLRYIIILPALKGEAGPSRLAITSTMATVKQHSKDDHPSTRDSKSPNRFTRASKTSIVFAAALAIVLATWLGLNQPQQVLTARPRRFGILERQEILAHCAAIRSTPMPPDGFLSRDESDRFEAGTNATLIRNARIFTGEKNGTVIVHGDILLDKGVIKGLGEIPGRVIDSIKNLTVVQANGAWVTPGLGKSVQGCLTPPGLMVTLFSIFS